MKTLQDCFGHQVRLTDERLAHILEHPEMKDMGTARQAATKPRSPVGARPSRIWQRNVWQGNTEKKHSRRNAYHLREENPFEIIPLPNLLVNE